MSFALLFAVWLFGAWSGALVLLFVQAWAHLRGEDETSQATVRFSINGTPVLSMTLAELEALGGIDCDVDPSQL